MRKIVLLIGSGLMLCLGGCGIRSGANGELVGVQGRKSFKSDIPYGMVYVPAGTFLMGQTDQDITYSHTAPNRQVSVSAFYMDETEITNNEYRQFVYWVRDSIAAKVMGGDFVVQGDDGTEYINPDNKVQWGGKRSNLDFEQLSGLFYQGDDQVFGRRELDVRKLVYQFAWFDYRAAAIKTPENRSRPRSDFIMRDEVAIYPDTLVWLAEFSYAQNEPMVQQYFTHPAYDDYPVVGVTWRQARAFSHWRADFNQQYKARRGLPARGLMYLPTEAQFEWAARGGRVGADYPWGGPYIRNSKGCLLANFKPGRGNYADDGGLYTVHVKSYFPNDYGLYNMAGNVAEWTSSTYHESSYMFVHDMNPTYSNNATEDDPISMKRKVVKGGSWKDIGYFLQTGVRTYEYQDTAKSYIGFRNVSPVMGKAY